MPGPLACFTALLLLSTAAEPAIGTISSKLWVASDAVTCLDQLSKYTSNIDFRGVYYDKALFVVDERILAKLRSERKDQRYDVLGRHNGADTLWVIPCPPAARERRAEVVSSSKHEEGENWDAMELQGGNQTVLAKYESLWITKSSDAPKVTVHLCAGCMDHSWATYHIVPTTSLSIDSARQLLADHDTRLPPGAVCSLLVGCGLLLATAILCASSCDTPRCSFPRGRPLLFAVLFVNTLLSIPLSCAFDSRNSIESTAMSAVYVNLVLLCFFLVATEELVSPGDGTCKNITLRIGKWFGKRIVQIGPTFVLLLFMSIPLLVLFRGLSLHKHHPSLGAVVVAAAVVILICFYRYTLDPMEETAPAPTMGSLTFLLLVVTAASLVVLSFVLRDGLGLGVIVAGLPNMCCVCLYASAASLEEATVRRWTPVIEPNV